MSKHLSIFNWSLRKALETEPDSFIKARVRIIYTILIFSLVKAATVIVIGSAHDQWLQVVRAAVAAAIYIILFKVLLSAPARLKQLAHILLSVGILIIWTNIFVYAHKVNLVSVQFVFMVVLSSFYMLGSVWGIGYSIAGMLPVMLFLVFRGNVDISFSGASQEFASPGYEIIVVLNFVSMIVTHYLFFEAFSVNIAEKEKLNQQLLASVAEAHELAASKSNFLSTISHELRTPLNSVIGMAELLIDDKPEKRQEENLKVLQFSALDLLSLINNVLDFNKIDSDKVELEATPFCLAEFMQNISAGLRIKANEKMLDFALEVDPLLEEVNIVSDPTRLSQLIYNLVSNAIKFTDKGAVTIKLEYVSSKPGGVEVLFSVTDTGIGIHPDRHDKIFDLFTQAESSTTRKYGGTGLGLAIVKQLLGLFNSEIQLESSPHIGSKFFFTIPFTTTTEVLDIVKPASSEREDLSHMKVLIAEDYEFNRLIMKMQLDKLNLTYHIVENGLQAYEACMSGYYDAILMDLHMPELDGYEATKQIRAHADPAKSKMPIIAFTASVTEQQKIFDAGFNDYLYKPMNLNDLRDRLEKISRSNKESVMAAL